MSDCDWTRSNICPHCGRVNLEALRSVQVSPSATPSRRNAIPPRRPNNSFEKGNRLDERGLPYLDRSGSPLKMKEKFDRRDYGAEKITIHGGNG